MTTLQSFDLFDTLIARRCIDPVSLYQLVEVTAAKPGLAQARSQAGHALWLSQKPHDTQAIYNLALQQLGTPDPAHAHALAMLEFDIERDQLIPVRRYLERLNSQSIIITDMHHPLWQLRELAQQAAQAVGLRCPLAVYASNRGKHDGVLWQALRARGWHMQHVGDNAHSDLAQAQAHGHETEWTDWTQPSHNERLLLAHQMRPIAQAARAARLRCVTAAQAPDAALQLASANWAFPMLALACVWLHSLARERQCQRLVFVGRDGAVWQRLFMRLFPHSICTHVHASRAALRSDSAAYVAYVRHILANHPRAQTLWVDLCGSGASWAVFARRHGLQLPTQVFAVRYANVSAPHESIDACALFDASAAATTGAHALEAICEEAYPSSIDVLFDTVDPESPWAVPRYAGPGDGSVWPDASVVQSVLDVGFEELVRAVPREGASIALEHLQTVGQALFAQGTEVLPIVDARSQFWRRNRAAA